VKATGIAYVLYYIILFFAYWFGSARFDFDGDGDFDPTDVQAYLQDQGFLRKNNRRKLTRSDTVKCGPMSPCGSGKNTPRGKRSPSGRQSPSGKLTPNPDMIGSTSEPQELEDGKIPTALRPTETSAPGAEDNENESLRLLGEANPLRSAGEAQAVNTGAEDGNIAEAIVLWAGEGEDGAGAGGQGDTGAGVRFGPVVATAADADADVQVVDVIEADGNSDGGWWDRDGDGEITFNDLLETKVSGIAEEDQMAQNLLSGQIRPVVVVLECFICFILWFACAVSETGGDFSTMLDTKAGLDTLSSGMAGTTDLRAYGPECEDLRSEVWRWFSYQFTHVGVTHVCMNIFLLLMLGIPLEGFHGHVRMLFMFNVGVFGGACCYFVGDGHTVVVGCSGGCYALIAIHFADLIMNWRSKKFRLPTLIMLLLLIGVDVMSTLLAVEDDKTSHTAHIGGFVCGLFIGLIMVKNIKWSRCEKCLFGTSVVLLLAFCGGCIGFLFSQAEGPQSIMDMSAGDPPWCWVAQVYNKTFFEAGLVEEMQCVRCGTIECIQYWKTSLRVGAIRFATCAEKGWFEGVEVLAVAGNGTLAL